MSPRRAAVLMLLAAAACGDPALPGLTSGAAPPQPEPPATVDPLPLGAATALDPADPLGPPEEYDGESVVIIDANRGCEGGGHELRTDWERRGAWLVRGERRVPAGVLDRLRELALTAPGIDGAELPKGLGITEESVEENRGRILDTVSEYAPHVLDLDEPEPPLDYDTVRKAALRHLLHPWESTDVWTIDLLLPGDPVIRLRSESYVPARQPWAMWNGEQEEPRMIVSLEISRLVALLVDEDSPSLRTLEGAWYWHDRFYEDAEVWDDVLTDPWEEQRARLWCEELDGWDAVAETWRVERADIGTTNVMDETLYADMVAKSTRLISRVRWDNVMTDDSEFEHTWDAFVTAHETATAAARRLPCLATWKRGAPGRTLTLDVEGTRCMTEDDPAWFHDPVWEHSGLAGAPEFELDLRIEGDWVATLLFSSESDGALILNGHASLSERFTGRYHPTTRTYAILRPSGDVEPHTMPPVPR